MNMLQYNNNIYLEHSSTHDQTYIFIYRGQRGVVRTQLLSVELSTLAYYTL